MDVAGVTWTSRGVAVQALNVRHAVMTWFCLVFVVQPCFFKRRSCCNFVSRQVCLSSCVCLGWWCRLTPPGVELHMRSCLDCGRQLAPLSVMLHAGWSRLGFWCRLDAVARVRGQSRGSGLAHVSVRRQAQKNFSLKQFCGASRAEGQACGGMPRQSPLRTVWYT